MKRVAGKSRHLCHGNEPSSTIIKLPTAQGQGRVLMILLSPRENVVITTYSYFLVCELWSFILFLGKNRQLSYRAKRLGKWVQVFFLIAHQSRNVHLSVESELNRI